MDFDWKTCQHIHIYPLGLISSTSPAPTVGSFLKSSTQRLPDLRSVIDCNPTLYSREHLQLLEELCETLNIFISNEDTLGTGYEILEAKYNNYNRSPTNISLISTSGSEDSNHQDLSASVQQQQHHHQPPSTELSEDKLQILREGIRKTEERHKQEDLARAQSANQGKNSPLPRQVVIPPPQVNRQPSPQKISVSSNNKSSNNNNIIAVNNNNNTSASASSTSSTILRHQTTMSRVQEDRSVAPSNTTSSGDRSVQVTNTRVLQDPNGIPHPLLETTFVEEVQPVGVRSIYAIWQYEDQENGETYHWHGFAHLNNGEPLVHFGLPDRSYAPSEEAYNRSVEEFCRHNRIANVEEYRKEPKNVIVNFPLVNVKYLYVRFTSDIAAPASSKRYASNPEIRAQGDVPASVAPSRPRVQSVSFASPAPQQQDYQGQTSRHNNNNNNNFGMNEVGTIMSQMTAQNMTFLEMQKEILLTLKSQNNNNNNGSGNNDNSSSSSNNNVKNKHPLAPTSNLGSSIYAGCQSLPEFVTVTAEEIYHEGMSPKNLNTALYDHLLKFFQRSFGYKVEHNNNVIAGVLFKSILVDLSVATRLYQDADDKDEFFDDGTFDAMADSFNQKLVLMQTSPEKWSNNSVDYAKFQEHFSATTNTDHAAVAAAIARKSNNNNNRGGRGTSKGRGGRKFGGFKGKKKEGDNNNNQQRSSSGNSSAAPRH